MLVPRSANYVLCRSDKKNHPCFTHTILRPYIGSASPIVVINTEQYLLTKCIRVAITRVRSNNKFNIDKEIQDFFI